MGKCTDLCGTITYWSAMNYNVTSIYEVQSSQASFFSDSSKLRVYPAWGLYVLAIGCSILK